MPLLISHPASARQTRSWDRIPRKEEALHELVEGDVVPGSQLDCEEPDNEGAEVGEHVGGVGHDGEGVAHVAADDLAHHEDHRQEDGDEELPPRLGHRLLPPQRHVGAGVGVAVVQRPHLLGRRPADRGGGIKRVQGGWLVRGLELKVLLSYAD